MNNSYIRIRKTDFYPWLIITVLVILVLCFYAFLSHRPIYLRVMDISSNYSAKNVAMKVDFEYHDDLVILDSNFKQVPFFYDEFYENNSVIWIKSDLTNGTMQYLLFYTDEVKP